MSMNLDQKVEADGNRQAFLREQEAKALRIATARIAKREASWRKKAQRSGPVVRVNPSNNSQV